jgi:cyclin-dependent kinase-like
VEPLTDYVATRWYRAPELLLNSTTYDKTVDLWAVACIMGELTDGQPLFPGDNEIDQLYMIQKVSDLLYDLVKFIFAMIHSLLQQKIIGSLTADQYEMYNKNPRYVGTKLQEIARTDSLEKRYATRMSRKALLFMKSVLKMDPKDRPDCTTALKHPYFEGIGEEFHRRGEVLNNSLNGSVPRPLNMSASNDEKLASTNMTSQIDDDG